jgi:hypothetical protein
MFAGQASGGDLHFIALADTLEVDIGTVEDLENAQTWAQEIASNTGLTLQWHDLSGQQLTIANVNSTLNNLDVSDDDVVYCYYSGHGGNPGDSIWPMLYFSTSGWADDNISVDDIVDILSPKSPRLLIVIADCCNNYPDQAAHPGPRVSPFRPVDSESFKRLFLNFAGTILASGCQPGQYSLGGQGYGGVFTNCFLESFYSLAETKPDSMTWEEVFIKARADTQAEAELSGGQQVPQYEIDGTEDSSSTTQDDPASDDDDQVLSWDPLDMDGPDDDDADVGAGCAPVGLVPLMFTMMGMHYIGQRRKRSQFMTRP